MKIKRKMRGNFIKKTKIVLLSIEKMKNPDEVPSLSSLSSKHFMRFLACPDFTVVLVVEETVVLVIYIQPLVQCSLWEARWRIKIPYNTF